MKKMNAAQRFERLREIEQLRDDLTAPRNDLRAKRDNSDSLANNLKRKLEDLTGPLGSYGYRKGRTPQAELDSMKAKIAEFEARRDEIDNELRPIQSELDQLESEYQTLQKNPPKVIFSDIKKVKADIAKTEAEIARVHQASGAAEARTPQDELERLKVEVEEAAADRDLLAADVDLGEGSEADLKKATARLTRLEKQLAELEQSATQSEATSRGYTRRLDKLQAQKHSEEKELACLLTLYAAEMHGKALESFISSAHELQSALNEMLAASELSENYGDRTPLYPRLTGFRIPLPEVEGLGIPAIGMDSDAIEKRITQILSGLDSEASFTERLLKGLTGATARR